jgi:hypothetical protein
VEVVEGRWLPTYRVCHLWSERSSGAAASQRLSRLLVLVWSVLEWTVLHSASGLRTTDQKVRGSNPFGRASVLRQAEEAPEMSGASSCFWQSCWSAAVRGATADVLPGVPGVPVPRADPRLAAVSAARLDTVAPRLDTVTSALDTAAPASDTAARGRGPAAPVPGSVPPRLPTPQPRPGIPARRRTRRARRGRRLPPSRRRSNSAPPPGRCHPLRLGADSAGPAPGARTSCRAPVRGYCRQPGAPDRYRACPACPPPPSSCPPSRAACRTPARGDFGLGGPRVRTQRRRHRRLPSWHARPDPALLRPGQPRPAAPARPHRRRAALPPQRRVRVHDGI